MFPRTLTFTPQLQKKAIPLRCSSLTSPCIAAQLHFIWNADRVYHHCPDWALNQDAPEHRRFVWNLASEYMGDHIQYVAYALHIHFFVHSLNTIHQLFSLRQAMSICHSLGMPIGSIVSPQLTYQLYLFAFFIFQGFLLCRDWQTMTLRAATCFYK